MIYVSKTKPAYEVIRVFVVFPRFVGSNEKGKIYAYLQYVWVVRYNYSAGRPRYFLTEEEANNEIKDYLNYY